ncbi:MAG: hypothetical protein Q8Q10_04075 [bacterium]|nr:hypothetical protein [bacterium]
MGNQARRYFNNQTEMARKRRLSFNAGMAIEELRRGNMLAFAFFAKLLIVSTDDSKIAEAKRRASISKERFAEWKTAYEALPAVDRKQAEDIAIAIFK